MKKSIFGMIIPAILAICLAGCPTESGDDDLASPATITGPIKGSIFDADGTPNTTLATAGFTLMGDTGNDATILITNGTDDFDVNGEGVTFTLKPSLSDGLKVLGQPDGVSVSDPAVEFFCFKFFAKLNGSTLINGLFQEKDKDHRVEYFYVDRDVTIIGTGNVLDESGETINIAYNLNFKEGWNSYLHEYMQSETPNETLKSGKPDASYRWVYRPGSLD